MKGLKSHLMPILAGALLGDSMMYNPIRMPRSIGRGSNTLTMIKGSLQRTINAGHLKRWEAAGWKTERTINRLDLKRRGLKY